MRLSTRMSCVVMAITPKRVKVKLGNLPLLVERADENVGGQQNSAGLVGMVRGNDRELVAGDLSCADRAGTEWVACCGRGIKVERNKQR